MIDTKATEEILIDLEQYNKVLKNWRYEEGKKIIGVLKKLTLINTRKTNQFQQLYKVVHGFHRQINKADEDIVDPTWYTLCIQIKQNVRKMRQTVQRLAKQEPPLVKKPSVQIICPPQLTVGCGTDLNSSNLRMLYKGFVGCYQQAANNPLTVPFVKDTYKQIKKIFPDTKQNCDDQIRKRCFSIATRLNRQTSTESKIKMLNGQMTAARLATNDLSVYENQRMRDLKFQFQKQMVEASSSTFYQQLKKNINKDGCEDCIFCKNKTAYCEDMKQTRASDQPMTRFMRCNTCDKGWRD